MSRSAQRRMAALAESRLAREHTTWLAKASVLHARIEGHRMRWLLGGGFAAGMMAERLPWRLAATFASLGFRATSFVLRFPIGTLLAKRAGARTD